MKKSTLKQLAANYDINSKALKQTLKADGIDRKSATLQEVLECIFVNAPALLYCRQDGSGGVEYADPMTCKQLIADAIKAQINFTHYSFKKLNPVGN